MKLGRSFQGMGLQQHEYSCNLVLMFIRRGLVSVFEDLSPRGEAEKTREGGWLG